MRIRILGYRYVIVKLLPVLTDPDPDAHPAFFVIDLQDANKK